MWDAKSFVLDLAVAVIDGITLLPGELLEPLQVGALIIAGAGQGLRARPFGGEQGESLLLHPLPGGVGHLRMAGVARGQPFGKHLVELVRHSVDEADAGGAGSVVLQVVLFKLLEVKIIPAIGRAAGLFESPGRNREDGQPRRQAKRLLNAGQADIGAQRGQIKRDRRHGGDRIDDKRNIRVLLHHFGDFRQRRHDAGGRFIVHQGHGIVFPTGQGLVNHLCGDRLPPFGAEQIRLDAAAAGDVMPFGTEGAVAEASAALLHQVAHRALHHPESARGREKHGILGIEQGLQSPRHFFMQLGILRHPVSDHRGAHGFHDIGGDFHWTGNKKFFMHLVLRCQLSVVSCQLSGKE